MYIGLDLHTRYSQIAVLSAEGEIVAEPRLENDRDTLEALASEYAGSEVAIEATGSYRNVFERLDQEMAVALVNPSKTRVIAESTVKTDSIDGKMLAHLLQADLVAESYVLPEDIRQARDLGRARKSIRQGTDCREKLSERGAVTDWEQLRW